MPIDETHYEYVGIWARAWASVIDSVLVCVIVYPALTMIYGREYFSTSSLIKGPADFLLQWVLPAVAIIVFWTARQATPGKMAIHAKIAAPDRPMIAYVGDGAWGISLNELLTCAREKIGVTVVVFNNGQWGAEKKNHVDFYSQRFQAVDLVSPSWAGVAKAFGCEGVTVDKLSDVGPALQASVRAQSEGKTTVLEMMVTRELGDPFRRDALSKPVRFLDKYKAYT
jgi:glyoxylate carboligase